MTTIKFWVAEQDEDAACFNLIARTKSDLINQIKDNNHNYYPRVYQVVRSYTDAFSLFAWETGENGGRDRTGRVVSEYKLEYKRDVLEQDNVLYVLTKVRKVA